jgi:hypothetical protein
VSLRSAEADANGAYLQMQLPAGVAYTSYQPVPEPSSALLQAGALLGLLVVRRFRSMTRVDPVKP